MEPQKLIGLRVREMRGKQTQQQIAQRMESLGYSMDRSAVARIESGERRMTVEEFLVLAAALGATPTDLLTPNEGDVIDIGSVPLDAGSTRRWLSGEQPEAILLAEVHREAHDFARRASGSVDVEWVKQVAEEVIADQDLKSLFQEAATEPPKRRALRVHLVMSTAAHHITESKGEGE